MSFGRRHVGILVTIALAATVACGDTQDNLHSKNGGTDPNANVDPTAQGIPFEPIGPYAYVPKVKNLLTGLPPTDDEVKAVVADPNALKGLIDGWMKLPSFKVRMVDFFRNAFQQNQVDLNTLFANLNVNPQMNGTYSPLLLRNIMDSFALTAWQLMDEGKPFTDAMTTHRYMMTTAMMSALSYIDDNHVDDARKTLNRLSARNALTTYTFDSASTATLTDSLDPANGNYMKWKFPGVQPADCTTATAQTFTQTGDNQFYGRLFSFLWGRGALNPCNAAQPQTQNFVAQYADTDWTDWRMVEIKPVATAGADPAFWDIGKLRTTQSLTLHTNRMGFFGTLAFDANWGTNITNEARVTANQALIVALGSSIAGESTIVNFPVNATDASHASDPACQGCHSQLDPYKQFFRQSYSLSYGDQTDATELNSTAGFNFGGTNITGKGVQDVANIFVGHERLPIAWVGKLHFWANSTPAIDTDPEVIRIAAAFKGSSFDFRTLVRELFSSPLVTWASATTTTTTNGVIVSISRRDQFCASLSTRLGLDDVCGMTAIKPTNDQKTISQRALLLPVDTYYRAYALPSLPTNPDLFFRQSTESICKLVGDQVVDVKAPGTSKYLGAEPDKAIADFVGNIMAIVPSDPRAAQATAILKDNFTAAQASGVNATDALKATFTLACIAPTSVVVGL